MTNLAREVAAHLRPLVGLPLSASHRAADMPMFDFGTMRPAERGAVGEYALHVQCAWRIETADRVVVGRHDMFEPPEEPADFDWGAWDWSEATETLQDRLMAAFLQEGPRVVEGVQTDDLGGAVLLLSGKARLVLFPTASQGEHWRLFRPGQEGPHFVVASDGADSTV